VIIVLREDDKERLKFIVKRAEKDGNVETAIESIRNLALSILSRQKHCSKEPILSVSGPISTGGLGSVQANLRAFRKVVRYLSQAGFVVFDPTIFEKAIKRIFKGVFSLAQNDRLLKDFYFPIFESGFIKVLIFLPRWQTSYGSRKEHQKAKRCDILTLYWRNAEKGG